MREIDSDIELFNDYVLGLVSKLSARGEQTQDLLVNLFKGYKACKDAEFVDYIKKKEDFYEEGEYQQLMDWALNKFKTRKESEQWCLKTTEEETIIALQSQVKTLMSNQKKPNPASGKSSGGGKKDNKQGNKKDKGKGKFRVEDLPAWVYVHPKEGRSSPRLLKARTTIGAPITTGGPDTSLLTVRVLVSKVVPRRIKATRVKAPSLP
ncbi:hypothetical protein MHU86_7052 [Fragilaria crotonensis]|nr:hypothetical protein MHU86_7052 [Fragilaria crotonensis]